jgi:uncharacterized protein
MHIIDFHAHIYPDKIAIKAARAIGEFYDAPIAYHGLVSELIKSGSAIGVERYIVHSTATKSAQVASINDYIIGETKKESRFVGFGTIHPDFANPREEIDRIRAAGLRGIKLHPDFQKFAADTPAMDGIYEILSDAGMPVLIHAGDCRYDFSGPRRIARVLDRHPRLKLVAAHFGGYTEWDESFELLAGRGLWFDTSSTLWKLPAEKAKAMIAKHGAERFLFGSDFPMWDHADELSRFLSLGLSEAENRAILSGNAEALLDG